jgi:hypothetical protein
MRLDRNINANGLGKYALIKLRSSGELTPALLEDGAKFVIDPDHVDFGDSPDSDFFVIRIKDKCALPALRAYAEAAMDDDPEFAMEVLALAEKSEALQDKRMPD